MDISTGRPVSLAPRGMVTSPHSLASSAGVDVLRAGGSAIDAAIAASAVLAVVYPHMTGLGGDAFWLVHDGGSGEIKYLNGGGKAAAGASLAAMEGRGLKEIPLRGIVPATLTVPGAVASWGAAHEALGRLPLQRVLESAIGYARDGFPATGRLASFIAMMRDDLVWQREAAGIFLPGGAVPSPGTRLTNPNLARTLEAIGDHGWSGFYEGPVAAEMVRFSQAQGGFFQPGDFEAQRATWGMPLTGRYRDVTIFNTPPPTQGFTVIEMLNLLEPLEPHRMDLLGPDRLHLMVQAKQIAYHDRDLVLADPAFAEVPVETLISKDYARKRGRLIDPARALKWDEVPSFGSLAGDTVYIAAVDRDGNAASLIQSLYGGFGSCVVAGSTGVVLQNRGAYFSLDPNHPNRLEPRKIPLHTLIASMAKRDGKLCSVLGCMGADGQPQIQLQLYSAMIDHGLDIQEAIELPRFLSGRFGLGEARDTLHMENRFPADTIRALEQRGHIVHRWAPWEEMAGHAHGITISLHDGTLSGGSDPRSDGAAIGY
ncbi:MULTISPECIES: gamma-glutamyltransferase [unclassified Bradyrhizobium]|uniref:gamma-glutamyltransferase n=1 Tax=unclassified Bradyrhizobium TaxID=2631580 RepID=UPI001BAB67E4|nr:MULTISPECIES: gamma-glutamyltransferase [unclassified Bradyrhizobium]MBR1227902.1 gamma-glutamyltransferase [Bradyrhizobium sp. AUGA SZCCT0176]MBR1300791.1 gamma-glutamyltransferase [Bradyrhizobium sp. AUGA SZCCT0042]